MTDSKEPRNDVIEAVARAIYEHNKNLKEKFMPDFLTPPYEHDTNGFYAGQARAALAAVLDHMEKPGVRNELVAAVCKASEMPGIRMIADGYWQAMLAQYRKEELGDD